ncbi:MAG: hypothetical protein HY294_07510 [Candidatus Rokubacteria bacterium]|nr:hypothetical protein [Candidatus Rokubacteria bacterium]
MRHLVFALQLKGHVTHADGRFNAKTSASSQTLRTQMTINGVQPSIERAGPLSIVCESEIQPTGEETYEEHGTITYSMGGKIRFKGLGRIGPCPLPHTRMGTAVWEITEGEGKMAGATGLITVTFTLADDGAAIDNHFAQIFLP